MDFEANAIQGAATSLIRALPTQKVDAFCLELSQELHISTLTRNNLLLFINRIINFQNEAWRSAVRNHNLLSSFDVDFDGSYHFGRLHLSRKDHGCRSRGRELNN